MSFPSCTQQFLDAVTACTWSGGHLSNGGIAYYLHVMGGAWEITAAPGDTIAQGTYNALHGATAQTDGSFIVASGGAQYWLADARGVAVLETWSPPPPKP